jgi:hypothetical protein
MDWVLLFMRLIGFDRVVLWKKEDTVSGNDGVTPGIGGDCLCTNSVISFSAECPDLGNWRLRDSVEGPERTTILVERLYRICRDARALPPSFVRKGRGSLCLHV